MEGERESEMLLASQTVSRFIYAKYRTAREAGF